MTTEDIRSVLAPLVETRGDDEIIHTADHRFISVAGFQERFATAELTLASLSAHEQADDGWRERFEDWHQRGILPA